MDFYFNIGGFLSKYDTIKIKSGEVWHRCAFGDSQNDNGFEKLPVSPEQLADFWEKLEQVGIDEWDDEYIDTMICDGTQWKLKVKCREIYGDNAYPPNWDEFFELVRPWFRER
jgi:hypothetical protein